MRRFTIGGLSNRAPATFDGGAIAGPIPAPSVEDRVFVLLSKLTPVRKDFGVVMLRDRARAIRVYGRSQQSF